MARKFGMGFLGVLMEALGIFLVFDFVPHSITPVTRDPEYTPPPPGHGIPLYITVYHSTSRTISLFEPMIVRTKINN